MYNKLQEIQETFMIQKLYNSLNASIVKGYKVQMNETTVPEGTGHRLSATDCFRAECLPEATWTTTSKKQLHRAIGKLKNDKIETCTNEKGTMSSN